MRVLIQKQHLALAGVTLSLARDTCLELINGLEFREFIWDVFCVLLFSFSSFSKEVRFQMLRNKQREFFEYDYYSNGTKL